MNELIVSDVLTYILLGLINICIGYFFIWFKKFLKKHDIIKEIKAHQEIVQIAVKAVQEAYGKSDGNEKFEIAKDWIIKIAQEKGLKVNEKEVDFLIDSVVKDMKKQFGDTWKEIQKEESK